MASKPDVGICVKLKDVSAACVDGESASPVFLGPLNLEIRRGEFLSIVGPKGCGKSLLLRIIAGLSAARTGEVIFDATFAARRDKLGFVFRRPALLPWRSILGNLMLRAELDNIERKVFEQCVRHLLASMGLHGLEDCLPCKLQIEQAQRAAICHALVHKPSLVLMDDPLGCMDFVAREHAGADIQRLWMEGSFAVVFATGDVTEAVRLSDRVVLMYPNPGRILQIMAVGLPRPRRLDKSTIPQLAEHVSRIRTVFRAQGLAY